MIEDDGDDVNAIGANGRTPLHRAASGGHYEICLYLIKMGGDIFIRDRLDRAPIFWACVGGHFNIVELLLKRGSYLMDCSSKGTTVLMAAVTSGSYETVNLLIKWVEKHSNEYDMSEFLTRADFDGRDALFYALKKDKAIANLIKIHLNKGTNCFDCFKKIRYRFQGVLEYSYSSACCM
mmetsp:Transcript_18143/g.25637  ORF Transcript_18143/g.25637 Transcript_18143/m.25637 type:complete len:179 (-) Transcript_18143:154-690(-)